MVRFVREDRSPSGSGDRIDRSTCTDGIANGIIRGAQAFA